MKPLGYVVVVVVPGVLITQVSWLALLSRRRRRRRMQIVTWGEAFGLREGGDDELPASVAVLHLLGRGFERGVDGMVTGIWQGRRVHVADYWYCDNDNNHGGLFGPSYARYSVAFAELDVELPEIRIDGETTIDRAGDSLVPTDIEFESEAFNRWYRVHAAGREYAYKLLDARMIDFILETPGPQCYEVGGQWVAAYCRRLPVSEFTTLLHAAAGFAERVPRLVRQEALTRRRRSRF